MKSQDMFQNAYGNETFYLTVDEAVNFADTTKYIWKGGEKTILINVALSDATDIRLPEATTDNAGLKIVGFSVVGDGYKRLELDKDGEVAKAGGEAGTTMDFYYTGVANVVIYRGNLIADVDSATGTTHAVTTTIIA